MDSRINNKTAIAAAFFVLFCAMLSPLISVAVSIIGLVALGIYKFLQKDR